jgi:3-isopropylmalate/(R)-2-methylmalate dehydratase small subunit
VKPIAGRAWVFGDDINTDALAPGLYFKSSIAEMARHCLETLEPRFAGEVQPGDIILAGRNFGMGSAREQAALVLRELGVGAVLARSFGRIFYRNALNFGLPALVFPEPGPVQPGEWLEVDPVAGVIRVPGRGLEWRVAGLPVHLMAMIEAGGLMPWLKLRIERGELRPAPARSGREGAANGS